MILVISFSVCYPKFKQTNKQNNSPILSLQLFEKALLRSLNFLHEAVSRCSPGIDQGPTNPFSGHLLLVLVNHQTVFYYIPEAKVKQVHSLYVDTQPVYYIAHDIVL